VYLIYSSYWGDWDFVNSSMLEDANVLGYAACHPPSARDSRNALPMPLRARRRLWQRAAAAPSHGAGGRGVGGGGGSVPSAFNTRRTARAHPPVR
jgi:hypothetical protein